MNKLLTSDAFVTALINAGIISDDEPAITKVTITAEVNHVVKIVVEHEGDERLLQLIKPLPVAWGSSGGSVGGGGAGSNFSAGDVAYGYGGSSGASGCAGGGGAGSV